MIIILTLVTINNRSIALLFTVYFYYLILSSAHCLLLLLSIVYRRKNFKLSKSRFSLQLSAWEIDNEIYLYKMLTTNLLQAMLVRRAEQSHQHQQSSNSALLMHWVHTQSKSETITTQLSTRWSSHIHRMTATSLHTCCSSYTTYTYILRRHDSAFAHI